MNRPVLNRQKAARWTFGLALVLYIHRFFTHSLVHQMHQPLLFEADFDYTYWLYQASGFAGIFVKTPVGAWIFDAVLGLSTLACWLTRARQRWLVMVSAISWSLYGLTYNSYSCHHNVTMIGIMVLPYAFLARGEKAFGLGWDGFRYFCCYAYADAFVNKAFLGRNIFFLPNGSEFIKTNQAVYMLDHPGAWLTGMYTWFITHPVLAYAGFLSMVLLQGLMVVGFFTKKWDRYLFFIPILFHTINWIFVDVLFYELLILNLTLLPLKERGAGQPLQHAADRSPVGGADKKDIAQRPLVKFSEHPQVIAKG